jgi:two-component system, chemotaxis family, chemotaxis protein CheY
MILLIEDDVFWVKIIQKLLEPMKTLVARHGEDGLYLFSHHPFEMVITDLVMPVKDGISTIVDLRKIDPKIPILAISGGGNIGGQGDLLRVATNVGATDTLAKPFGRDQLLEKVRKYLPATAGGSDPAPDPDPLESA